MQIDRDAPLRFLRTAFLWDDWIAVLLKSHDTGDVVQRVGPVSMVLAPRFQSWLRFKNARRFSLFVGVNAITPGRRTRTRESVGAVRHVFLDADQDADRVLDAIAARPDLPLPSYVVGSSKGRAHVLWRVEGFGLQRAEVLQKHLARELGTDVAATSAAQMTRVPGFFNHKYSPPQFVEVAYGEAPSSYGVLDFPGALAPVEPPAPVAAKRTRRRSGMPMVERARRYLAATPPAIEGQRGDARTFCVCCRLIDRFGLTEDEAMHLLSDWNARCQPPWTVRELVAKVRSATRSHRDRVLLATDPTAN
ncbi:MAG: DNA-primase RepB domain-containing protein [Acidobacteriota bacterium]